MVKFPFLRRPLKLILYAVLLSVTTATALTFALQYMLDGRSLEHAINSYAYVGTVRASERLYAMQEELPETVVHMVTDSPLVDDLDIRSTFAAKVLDAKTVPDFMMTTDQVNQHYFAELVIISNLSPTQSEEICYDYYGAQLKRQWGSGSIVQAGITLQYVRCADEPELERQQQLFVVGNYVIRNNGVNSTYMQVYTPKALEALGMSEHYADNPLMMHSMVTIPEDLTNTEAEAFILDYMEQTGLASVYERYVSLSDAVTVRTTSDFTMLPYYLKGRIYMDAGRPLYASDAGKKVCLISQGFSLRNRLAVGDTVTLSIADGCYLSEWNQEGSGWESGYPMVGDEAVFTYGEAEAYEIVGIYHQLSRDTNDPLFYSVNDIFIPADGRGTSAVRPYAFSFRVTGPNYKAFNEAFGPKLEALGYELKVIDSDWEDVEETFYAMLDRQRLMLCCALTAFLVSLSMFVVLIYQNFRYEYGLMRLLGAYRKEAGKLFVSGYLFTSLPATVLAVLASWGVYVLWLKEAANAIMRVAMPGNGHCFALLAGLGAAQLILGLAVLLILVQTGERRSLLRMIR